MASPICLLPPPCSPFLPSRKLNNKVSPSPFSESSDGEELQTQGHLVACGFDQAIDHLQTLDLINKQKLLTPIPYRPPHLRSPQPDKGNIRGRQPEKGNIRASLHPHIQIRQVFNYNLKDEFDRIQAVLNDNTYVTLDTEFERPIIHSSIPYWLRTPEERYQLMKLNTDKISVKQLGITLTDSTSRLPLVWEFRFKDFRYEDYRRFCDLFWKCGLLCNNFKATWIVFSGHYDFGHLFKLLSGFQKLPPSLEEFMEVVTNYFGEKIYDVKNLATTLLYDIRQDIGLNDLAQQLQVQRTVGTPHNGGSDSLHTWHVFEKVRRMIGDDAWEEQQKGIICGLHKM